MASGQQKAKHNLDAFASWVATQTDEDFKQIVYRGEIATTIDCGKSALNQNPALKQELAKLETELRASSSVRQSPIFCLNVGFIPILQ